MTRLILLAALLAVVIASTTALVVVTATEAHHGTPYSANVRHARQWLRDHTNDRAFRCAHRLIENESGWAVHAGDLDHAYGLPQAYPGWKMIRARGRDAIDDATEQLIWATHYVRGHAPEFHSFCGALRFQDRHGYY
jgi:hypothetical protein